MRKSIRKKLAVFTVVLLVLTTILPSVTFTMGPQPSLINPVVTPGDFYWIGDTATTTALGGYYVDGTYDAYLKTMHSKFLTTITGPYPVTYTEVMPDSVANKKLLNLMTMNDKSKHEKQLLLWLLLGTGIDLGLTQEYDAGKVVFLASTSAPAPQDLDATENDLELECKQPVTPDIYIVLDRFVPVPSLSIEKSACEEDSQVPRGGTIHYHFTVTNNGNVPITNITIDDPFLDILGLPLGMDLGPGESHTVGANWTVPEDYVGPIDHEDEVINVATATGIFEQRPVTSPPDTVTIEVYDNFGSISGYKYAMGLHRPMDPVPVGFNPYAIGWTIQLYNVEDDLTLTTVTNEVGYFTFEDLPVNRTYVLSELFGDHADTWQQLPIRNCYFGGLATAASPAIYEYEIYMDAYGDLYDPDSEMTYDCEFAFNNIEIPHLTIHKVVTGAATSDSFTVQLIPWDTELDAAIPEGEVITKTIYQNDTKLLVEEDMIIPSGPGPHLPRYTGSLAFELPFGTYKIVELPKVGWEAPTYPDGQIFTFGCPDRPVQDKELSTLQSEDCDFLPEITIVNTRTPAPDPGPDPTPDPGPEPAGIQGNVVVNFINTLGEVLSPQFSFSGSVGTNYGTSPRTIDGYTLTITPDNATGTFIDGTVVVTYIYDDGTVVVPEVIEVPLAPALVPETPEPEPAPIVVETLLDETTPLGDALPVTGYASPTALFGIGSLISAFGVYLRKKCK